MLFPDATLTLAIDPGDHASGIAVWTRAAGRWALRASESVVGQVDQIEAASRLRGLLAAIGADPSPAWIVIESHTNPQISRAAMDSLAASRRTWESAAARVLPESELYRVPAATWQAGAGTASRKARGAVGDTKAAAMVLASEIMRPLAPSTHDEAEAVVMGDWWLRAGGAQVNADLTQRRSARRARAKSRGGWTPEALEGLRARGFPV